MKFTLLLMLSLFGSSGKEIDQKLDSAISHLYSDVPSLDSAELVLESLEVPQMSVDQKTLYFYIMADISDERNQQLTALIYYLEALRFAIEGDDSKTQHSMYNNIGRIFYYYDNHDISIDYYEKALALTDRPIKIGWIHYNLGFSYHQKEVYDLAIEHFHTALEKFDSDDTRAMTMNYLGYTYSVNNQYELAEKYLRDCIELNQASSITQAHHNLGLCLFKQGRKDEAVNSFKQAIKTDKDFFLSYLSLGSITEDLELLKMAESLYEDQKLEFRNIDLFYQLFKVSGDEQYVDIYKEKVEGFNKEKAEAEEMLRSDHVRFVLNTYNKRVELEQANASLNTLFNGSIVSSIILVIVVFGFVATRTGLIPFDNLNKIKSLLTKRNGSESNRKPNRRQVLFSSYSHQTIKGNLIFNGSVKKKDLEELINDTNEENIYLQAQIEDENKMELVVDDFEFNWFN